MKKKIYLCLLFLIGVLLLPIGVNAAESYSITAKVDGTDLTLKVNDIKEEKLVSYYVYICNENDEAPALPSTQPTVVDGKTMKGWHRVNTNTSIKELEGQIMINSTWYMYEGYTNAYVLKVNNNEEGAAKYTLSEKITIDKPKLFAPGMGWNFSFGSKESKFQNNTASVHAQFPSGFDGLDSNITVKIGMIEDSTVIQKFANKSSDAYSSLLAYAKKATNGKTITKISNGKSFEPGLDEIVKGAQYYILITVDEKEYRDLTDVYIQTGQDGWLSEFSQEASNQGTHIPKNMASQTKEPNPNTSDLNLLILSSIGIIMILIIGFSSKKLLKK